MRLRSSGIVPSGDAGNVARLSSLLLPAELFGGELLNWRMMEIFVRDATVSDTEAIVEFQLAMAWETEAKQLDRSIVTEGVRQVFDDPSRGFYLVGEAAGEVISSLLITFEWSDWRNYPILYLQSVFVEPAFRRQGLFRKMYEIVTQRAKANGSERLRLYVETENEIAQRVYESLGMNRLPYFMYEAKL